MSDFEFVPDTPPAEPSIWDYVDDATVLPLDSRRALTLISEEKDRVLVHVLCSDRNADDDMASVERWFEFCWPHYLNSWLDDETVKTARILEHHLASARLGEVCISLN